MEKLLVELEMILVKFKTENKVDLQSVNRALLIIKQMKEQS